jgi:integrase
VNNVPKLRKAENKGLPARWRVLHGAYYYQVPKGLEAMWEGKQLYRLGKSLSEAYRTWAEKLPANDNDVRNIGQLLDRYALEVIPTKAPKTRSSNTAAVKKLRAVFGLMPLESLKPQHVYQYVDKRKAKVAAHREIEVLSHAFTKAVQWGFINKHPFKGEVRLSGEEPRTRYVEDWEIVECLSLLPVRKRGSIGAIQSYIRLKLLTGMRRGDLLRLRVSDCKADGVHVTPHKTARSSGKQIIYEWTPELHLAIELSKASRPIDISPYLFCNRSGTCYINEGTGEAHGWKSMWQRFMERVLKETKVTQRFTEHDLRAKVGSDAESRERARALLGHVDERITERVYRRKPERVRPTR